LRALAPALRLAHRLDVPVEAAAWSFAEREVPVLRNRVADELGSLSSPLPIHAAATRDLSPGQWLAGLAAQREATIVMAAHGRTGVGQLLLGSIAEEVLRASAAPAVLVGPHVDAWVPDGEVLIGLDGSSTAEATLDPALAWSQRLGLRPRLVHICELGPSRYDDVGLLNGTYLQAIRDRVASEDVALETIDGDPGFTLARRATEHDLVAVATHGRTGLGRVLLGSVAMRVVHEAPCPVLVQPAPLDIVG
jgi:nucleotide-binding universal stress UspA family protein